ncbi:hypothetical protein M2405_004012 [Rhodococcus erythropolis]|nr:hypothetical protein [Rhodococcus erythropolis]MCW2425223.1 hypothetical protein [Rhodococcus erythropolis]
MAFDHYPTLTAYANGKRIHTHIASSEGVSATRVPSWYRTRLSLEMMNPFGRQDISRLGGWSSSITYLPAGRYRRGSTLEGKPRLDRGKKILMTRCRYSGRRSCLPTAAIVAYIETHRSQFSVVLICTVGDAYAAPPIPQAKQGGRISSADLVGVYAANAASGHIPMKRRPVAHLPKARPCTKVRRH